MCPGGLLMNIWVGGNVVCSRGVLSLSFCYYGMKKFDDVILGPMESF